jgi:hypothetical protein
VGDVASQPLPPPAIFDEWKPPNRWEMTMTWTLAVLAVALPVVVLAAWALWLLFNYLIAKHHGIEGLKATPPIATAFRPGDWADLIRGKAAPSTNQATDQQDPPSGEPPTPDGANAAGE